MEEGNDGTAILFYDYPGYFYSNFSADAFRWQGVLWPTAEHAYQAWKFTRADPLGDYHRSRPWELDFIDGHLFGLIENALSPHEAKRIAHEHRKIWRPDQDSIKLLTMRCIVRVKLSHHPYIREALLRSGDAEISEDSPTDGFWGRGPDGQGEDHLGKIYMELREELRHSANQ